MAELAHGLEPVPAASRGGPQLIDLTILAVQVRQLEATPGTRFPAASPEGTITRTAGGEPFARDTPPCDHSRSAMHRSHDRSIQMLSYLAGPL